MHRECLSFEDILLVPRSSDLRSRSDVDVGSAEFDLPIVMSPMDNVTTKEMIEYFVNNNMLATIHRYFKSAEDQLEFAKSLDVEYDDIFFSVGSIKNSQDWIEYLHENGVHNYCIDMAHGDCKLCADTIRFIKRLPDSGYFDNKESKFIYVSEIMAGNVATKSGFDRLQEAGADYIRVGIGCGSICSTRLNTGFGVPQFTAIQDCAQRKNGAKLIADGGIKNNGDIVKAMAAGADLVMLGKVLAGSSFGGGDCYDKNKELLTYLWNGDTRYTRSETIYKEYHGMASREARRGIMKDGSVEGVSGLIPYTGDTEEVINDIKLNLESALSYNGSKNWEDFKRTVKPIRVSGASISEGNTHVV